MTNPYSSEQFPPPPNFPLGPRGGHKRALTIRFAVLAVLLTGGILLLVFHHYPAGVLLVAWAVIRSAMVAFRVRRWRRRGAGRGGSWDQ